MTKYEAKKTLIEKFKELNCDYITDGYFVYKRETIEDLDLEIETIKAEKFLEIRSTVDYRNVKKEDYIESVKIQYYYYIPYNILSVYKDNLFEYNENNLITNELRIMHYLEKEKKRVNFAKTELLFDKKAIEKMSKEVYDYLSKKSNEEKESYDFYDDYYKDFTIKNLKRIYK